MSLLGAKLSHLKPAPMGGQAPDEKKSTRTHLRDGRWIGGGGVVNNNTALLILQKASIMTWPNVLRFHDNDTLVPIGTG